MRRDLKAETLLRKTGQMKDSVEWTCDIWGTSRIPWSVKNENVEPITDQRD